MSFQQYSVPFILLSYVSISFLFAAAEIVMTLQRFSLRLNPISDRPIKPLKWYFPLCFSAIVVFSAFRNRKSRLLCTVPILLLFSQFHRCHTQEPKEDYTLSLWLMWIFLRYIDISLLSINDKMWRQKKVEVSIDSRDNPEENWKTRSYLRDGSFTTRLKRSFSLWATLRGLRWNWEINHMKYHHGSRISFLFSTALKTISAITIQEMILYVRIRLPYGGPIPRIDISQAPLYHQLALCWLAIGHIFIVLTSVYGFAAIFCVALHIHGPRDWPFLFGDLSEAYTVGQAWSRTWHQTMRRVCTFLVSPLTGIIGVAKKTSLHRNITLIIGFTVSGLIHYAGLCNLPHSSNHKNYFFFFAVQPLAIMFEDGIMAVGRRLGTQPSRALKRLGYSWACVWITLSVRAFFLRCFLEDLYPVSDSKLIGNIASYFS